MHRSTRLAQPELLPADDELILSWGITAEERTAAGSATSSIVPMPFDLP
jgi:hypothetical protein